MPMSIPGNLLTTAMAVMPHKDVDRPRGVHLCGNPDWDFLLGMDLDILSLDVYTNGEVFASYAGSVQRFLARGGLLVLGVVPTNFESFEKEDMGSLIGRLEEIWRARKKRGIDRDLLVSLSLVSPATCCLVNPDGERTVEKAFDLVRELSERLRNRYKL
jgi:hypothetical protein